MRKPPHIYQRQDGRWQALIQRDGQRHCITRATREEVRDELATFWKQDFLGERPTAKTTLHALLDHWLESTQVCSSTRKNYTRFVRDLKLALPDQPLERLTPNQLQHYFYSLRETPAKGEQQGYTLKMALDLAVEWGYLVKNPIAKTNLPKRAKPTREWWTVEQTQCFLEHLNNEVTWFPFFSLILASGLRVSEAIGLRWTDVDETRGTVTVTHALYREDGEYVERAPKTTSGRRTVWLPSSGILALTRQRELLRQWGRANPNNFVFLGPRTNKPLARTTPSSILPRLCVKYGLPPIGVHTLRHLYGSLALQGGAPLPDVSRQMGHANVSITASVYAHSLGGGRLVAEALQNLFPNLGKTP